MHESPDDPLIARVADALRRPAPLSPDFDARVMAAVRRAAPPLPVRAWRWLREPRVIAVSPIGGLAMAAGIAGVMFVGVWSAWTSDVRRQASDVSVSAAAAGRSVVTFMLVAPAARSVALAGDFNDWDAARTPLRREGSGLWTLDVPLVPGRYLYAFVVDGGRFVADPAAPRAGGDDFGTPTSVVTVGGAPRVAGGAL
jgi:hypothetical protein